MILLVYMGALFLVLILPGAFWWGFYTYPRVTSFVFALFVLAVLFGGLTFNHFFPHCHNETFAQARVECPDSP